MVTLQQAIWRADRDERGASLVEYALLVALIAVVCIVAVTFLGNAGSGKLDEGGKGIQAAGAGEECPPGYHQVPAPPNAPPGTENMTWCSVG